MTEAAIIDGNALAADLRRVREPMEAPAKGRSR